MLPLPHHSVTPFSYPTAASHSHNSHLCSCYAVAIPMTACQLLCISFANHKNQQKLLIVCIQWNLRAKDTLGPTIMSIVEKLSSSWRFLNVLLQQEQLLLGHYEVPFMRGCPFIGGSTVNFNTLRPPPISLVLNYWCEKHNATHSHSNTTHPIPTPPIPFQHHPSHSNTFFCIPKSLSLTCYYTHSMSAVWLLLYRNPM